MGQSRLPFMKKRKRTLLVPTILLLLVLAHIGWIAIDGLTANPSSPADAAVVLGNAVNADGTLAPRTEARCRRALELYQAGLVKFIVTSGGYDAGVKRDEGTTMRDFLVSQGVPPDAVIADSKGLDTQATARNTAALATAHGWKSVIVVSQWYHLTRCRLAFHREAPGLKAEIASARFHEWREIYSTLREVPAFYSYLIK